MPELVILGTAASVPDAQHDTVGLVVRGPGWAVLADCGGSPLHKLARAGVGVEWIQAVLFTHRHADHLYGLPMLVQGLWLAGRQLPLPVYGPAETLDVARPLLGLFNLLDGAGMPPVHWHTIPPQEEQRVLEVGGIQITAAPVEHSGVETVALRFENTTTGRAIVYSADTAPCPALIRLAKGADLLIHEATGDQPGHSTPAQAAQVALSAGVRRLALIHYPVLGVDLEAWPLQASDFPGPLILAQDGDIYPF